MIAPARPRRLVGIVPGLLAPLVLALSFAPAAAAKPPANDSFEQAAVLVGLPAGARGTTVDARTDEGVPAASCAPTNRTVWYRWRAPAPGVAVVKLHASQTLDAVAAAYRIERSHLRAIACGTTDKDGLAALAFRVRRGTKVAIMVGKLSSSRPGTFRLRVVPREPLALPPGEPLPTAGVRSTLDPAADLDDAWSVGLDRGTTYRIRLTPSSGQCPRLAIYQPGTTSFAGSEPIRSLRCGGYMRLTPGPDGGGVYSFRVRTAAGHGPPQPYRLQVAAARPDDVAPGVLLKSGAVVVGSVDGRNLDMVDLYRFDAAQGTSKLTLDVSMTKPFDLLVLTADGHEVAAERGVVDGRGHIDTNLNRGHYFAAVRPVGSSSGRYRLRLFVGAITTTTLLASGANHVDLVPGGSTVLTVNTTAAAPAAPIQLEVDRFDPFDRWQFAQAFGLRAGSGYVTLRWVPPDVGIYRIRARLSATLANAHSESAYVRVTVADPLE